MAWSDRSANETGFTIERSTGGAAWSVVTSTLPAGTTSYQDTGLSASTSYSYRVKAVNAAGASSYSSIATATTKSSVLFTESFPGADGSLWDAGRWTVSNGSTASTDVQAGGGRLSFSNVSGARAQGIATMPKQVDTSTLASFRYSSTGARGYFYLFSRASGDLGVGLSECVVLRADHQ